MRIAWNLMNDEVLGWIVEAFGYHEPEGYAVRKLVPGNAPEDISSDPSFSEAAWLAWCHLQEDILLKQHKTTAAKARRLIEKQDAVFLAAIRHWWNQALHTFLEEVWKSGGTFCLQMKRNDLVSLRQVQVYAGNPITHIAFRRTEKGIVFQMNIEAAGKRLPLFCASFTNILNEPAWFIINRTLYHAEELKSSLVQTFTRKRYVEIARNYEKEYLRKFIAPIAQKAGSLVEAEGFEYHISQSLTGISLLPLRHLFSGQWGFRVEFRYDGWTCSPVTAEKRKTTLKFDDQDEPHIIQVRRNIKQENASLQELTILGLQREEDNFWVHPEHQGLESLIAWMKEQNLSALAKGISMEPTIGDKKIFIGEYQIRKKVSEENDWFQIKTEIRAGEFTIPFIALGPYLLQRNPYYPLPDGTFFYIPDEWMERYPVLFETGKTANGILKVSSRMKGMLAEDDVITGPRSQETETVKFNVPKGLEISLRPYQEEGVLWMTHWHNKGSGALLADDMGLGKTLQVITFLLNLKEKREAPSADDQVQLTLFEDPLAVQGKIKALVIVPASLVYNWQREIARFAPGLKVYIHGGIHRTKNRLPVDAADITITSYHTARHDIDWLEEIWFDCIVLDEAQYIKNPGTQLHETCMRLRSHFRLALTGTPVENSLKDLWSIMQFTDPLVLGNWEKFNRVFADPIHSGTQPERLEDLKSILKPFILRRTRGMVATELPEMIKQVQYVEMTEHQKELYEKERSSARNEILDKLMGAGNQNTTHVFNALLKLRQIANHPSLAGKESTESGKYDYVKEEIITLAAGNHKILLFSQFERHLDIYSRFLDDMQMTYGYITGKVGSKQRMQIVQQFENDDNMRVLLMTLRTGGVGLNLVAADYVLMLDPWWNPAAEEQAFARAHRIGQTKNVFVKKYITAGSIEENILRLQEKRSRIAGDILAGNGSVPLRKEDIEILLG